MQVRRPKAAFPITTKWTLPKRGSGAQLVEPVTDSGTGTLPSHQRCYQGVKLGHLHKLLCFVFKSGRKSWKIQDYDNDAENPVKFSSSSLYAEKASTYHNEHINWISISERTKIRNVQCRLNWIKIDREVQWRCGSFRLSLTTLI
jgi:hypothetical protein